MNKVVLIGRLTKDPDLKFTPSNGTAVTTLTLAVDRRFSKEGSKEKEADFIPIVIWGKQAESTANYMTKGRLMGVSGRMQTRSYEAKDGTRRYVTEVVAEEVQFLDGHNKSVSSTSSLDSSYGDDITPIDDGEIPF